MSFAIDVLGASGGPLRIFMLGGLRLMVLAPPPNGFTEKAAIFSSSAWKEAADTLDIPDVTASVKTR